MPGHGRRGHGGLGRDRLGRGWWHRALTEEERLAWDGVDGTRPAWVAVVEQAVTTAAPPDLPHSIQTWQEAFAIPLRPFLTGARDGLITAARDHLSPAQADLEATADTFTAALGRQLATIAGQTIVHELGRARMEGRLAGRDGHARFIDFIRQQCEPAALATVFCQYPVLARLLGTA